MSGFKRLSAVAWTLAALLLLLRAHPWSVRHDLPEIWLYAFAVVGPLVAHLVSLWVIDGFDRRHRG